jgi:uncharacterized membrane protein YvlD (DUF360 family)
MSSLLLLVVAVLRALVEGLAVAIAAVFISASIVSGLVNYLRRPR